MSEEVGDYTLKKKLLLPRNNKAYRAGKLPKPAIIWLTELRTAKVLTDHYVCVVRKFLCFKSTIYVSVDDEFVNIECRAFVLFFSFL